MPPVGLWQITGNGPRRLSSSNVSLEEHLETWLAADPGMIQGGLTVVCRQMTLEAGRLDLLALDPQGRFVVIEIKRGALYREAVAQALDYASCIATMPYAELSNKINTYLRAQFGDAAPTLESLLQERQAPEDTATGTRTVVTIVVGTGKAPALERMTLYLSQTFGVPLSLVSFEVFQTSDGQHILIREVTESETDIQTPTESPRPSIDAICALADQNGIGPQFRAILTAAQRHGLYAKPFKFSIMYTSPRNRTRTLFTTWANPLPGGLLSAWIGPQIFADYYPVTVEQAQQFLGSDGWRKMSASDVDAFVAGLDGLFREDWTV